MNASAQESEDELKRLRWRCRRGQKELDVLLEGWLTREWQGASERRRDAFRALLELPDPDLVALCFGRLSAADPDEVALLSELLPSGAVYTGNFGRTPRPENDL